MRRLINNIRHRIVCRREGFVKIYCPGCGKHFGDTSPMLTGVFTCGRCGTKWKKEIVKENENND